MAESHCDIHDGIDIPLGCICPECHADVHRELAKANEVSKVLAWALEQLERKMTITFKRRGAMAWDDICTAAQWLEKANADVSAKVKAESK